MIVSRSLLLALTPIYVFSASAQVAPPEKALKYHEVLLKRPQNAALFDRFYGAWIDEQPVETLESFLVARAAANGGQEWTVLARYQMRRGQEDKALESLAKAIEAVPEDPSLPMERAKIRLRRMEFENARADLAKVAAGKDEALALEAAKMTGKSWLREGRSDEAIKTWDALLAKHPGDEDLLEDLVESAAADGETEQALAYLLKLIETSTDPYKKTLRSIRRGDLLVQAGRTDEAVEVYAATLVEVGEGSWLEQQVLAQIDKTFRKQDRLSDLLEELKKLAEANPRRLFIHRQLAKLEASQGDIDAALGRFREVLQRSPGDRELREEFVRLLSDAERFDDAAAELEKMIALAPTEAELQLQLAALRNRQGKPEAVMAALKKARELLGMDEGNGIRIAGLMMQYGQNEAGETLLKELAAAPGAGTAASEALAAEYARTKRKTEALELLKKIGSSDDPEVILRVSSAISVLGESQTAYEILTARAEKFASEPRYVAALAQAAMAAGKPQDGIAPAVKLVRLAKQSSELADSLGLASRAIVAADKLAEWRTTLEAQATRSPAEICLLANLMELQSDLAAVEKLLTGIQDPLVLHFYAALLDRRGEYDRAIAEFSRLADTDEGRKAGYFKDLAELQQRAGKTEEALATVERWKQSAPGDKTAWITGSRLLSESGKLEQAIKMTRQAVSRFENDTDLAANLAALHQEAGETADAEAIYWRLYDAAETPADQARWAGPLAQLASTTGRVANLEEQLQERARGNRRSVGPLLAQVELARVTENEDKRRALLFEALRLQPDNVDLRLQIANLEEQSSNLEGSVALLEEALAKDNTGRIRAALAQAYLRQGKVVKGMREMQALAGTQAKDPRAIEASAASLAAAGMYDEAISFLREMLPDGGDWRSRYLLAIMLEQDGRETDAIPIYLSLLQAKGEIPSAKVPGANQQNPNMNRYLESMDPKVRELYLLTMLARQAYSHQSSNRSYYGSSGLSMTGPFALPGEVDEVKNLALIHLSRLAKKDPSASGWQNQLRSSGIDNADFLLDYLAREITDGATLASLLDKYPAQPGLLEMLQMFGGRYTENDRKLMADLARKVIAARKDLSPLKQFSTWMLVVMNTQGGDVPWDELFSSARATLASKEKGGQETVMSGFLYLLKVESGSIPDAHKQAIIAIMREHLVETPIDGEQMFINLNVMAALSDSAGWVKTFNSYLTYLRKNPNNGQMAMAQWNRAMIFRYMQSPSSWNYSGGQSPFELPNLSTLSFKSLPMEALANVRPKKGESVYYMNNNAIEPDELKGVLDQFESPAMRAWLANRIGDDALITKTLAATPPPEEAADFTLLKAYQAVKEKKYAEAYALMEQTRSARAADSDYQLWLSFTVVAIASEMTAAEREPIKESLATTLYQCRQKVGIQGAPIIAAKAQELGMEELAKRFLPPATSTGAGGKAMGPAGFAQAKGGSSGSSRSATMDRLNKLMDEKKYDAAAREALLLYRSLKSNPNTSSSELRALISRVTGDVIPEMLKQADPGESKSLTKRLEYAELCSVFGKSELALKVLDELEKERPTDTAISARLLFALPASQRQRALKLMKSTASSSEFINLVTENLQINQQRQDGQATLNLFDLVAEWLEITPAAELSGMNLTWVGYHGRQFYQRFPGSPSLLPDWGDDGKVNEQRKNIARKLGLAMLRHASTSEEGFRLLSCSTGWKFSDEELDNLARQAISNGAVAKSISERAERGYFILYNNNSTRSDGESMEKFSSVKWIVRRLQQAKNSSEILPPAYLEEVRQKAPQIADLLSLMADVSTVDQVKEFWKSHGDKKEGRLADMLKQGLLERAANVPGAITFFISTLNNTKLDFNRSNEFLEMTLMNGAILAGLKGNREELEATCAAISKCILGDTKSWKDGEDSPQFNNSVGRIDTLTSELKLPPADAVRLFNSFYKLGIPVGGGSSQATDAFEDSHFKTAEEVIAFLQTLGWLDGASTWEPYCTYLLGYEGNSYHLKKEFILEDALSEIETDCSSEDIVKLLKERKPATFGALMVAAAFSSEKERSDLTAIAFAGSKAELAKLSKSRLEKFELIFPWLPPQAASSLPPTLREKFSAIDEERLNELTKKADDYLSNKDNSRTTNYPFDEVDEFIYPLAEKDLAKSTEVFLEAEHRYTNGIMGNGRSNRSTTDGVQTNYRDYTLDYYLSDDDAPFVKNPELALRFIQRIFKSPEAVRFSLAERNGKGIPVLASIGSTILSQAEKDEKSKDPKWLKAAMIAHEYPEDIRQDAYIAIACADFSDLTRISASGLTENRKNAAELAERAGDFLPYREVSYGLAGWSADQPEGKAATTKALSTILANESIAETSRMQVGFTALSRAPELLADPGIAETLTALYERYCAGERSAVNLLSVGVENGISTLAITPESLPYAKRINEAFWKNANSSKAGGHSPISESVALILYISASNVQDETLAKKLLLQVKQSYAGNLPTITRLILARKFADASVLLRSADEIYLNRADLPVYTKELAERVAEFGKSGVDPLQFMRLECQLLRAKVQGAPETLGEARSDRKLRLANAYLKSPPASRLLQLEMLAAITESHPPSILLLREPLKELAKTIDYKETVRIFVAASEWNKDKNPRALIAEHEYNLLRAAALADLSEGQPELFTGMAKTLAECDFKNVADNSYYSQGRIYHQVVEDSVLWLFQAVATGRMEGFLKVRKSFEELALTGDEKEMIEKPDVRLCLRIHQFLSAWDGQLAESTEMLKRLKTPETAKGLTEYGGLVWMMDALQPQRAILIDPSFKETRRAFLPALFSKPEMAVFFPNYGRWVDAYAKAGLTEELQALGNPLPASFVPEVRTALMLFQARNLAAADKKAEAVAAFQLAVNDCPPAPPWNEFRATAKYELANALFNNQQTDEARTVFASINKQDVAGFMKDRYNTLDKKLAEKSKP